MENINNLITKNFTENIEYIQNNHPKLFEKLSAFDTAVQNGHYTEKYELVYENNNFDVLEKSTGKYLYDKNIDKHTQLSLQNIEYSTQHNCFEGFLRQTYTQEQVKILEKEKKENPLKSHRPYIADILNITEQQQTTQLSSIDKYIFFGVGLGIHVKAIAHKIAASSYLIVEDDLELFRLSLFCINYAQLAKNATLLFSVFEDNTEFAKTAQDFLKDQYYFNHYIKYFTLLSHAEDKIDQFYIALSSQADLKFLFNDYMLINTTPLQNITQGYPLLLDSFNISHSPLSETPFLLVASGPSLERNKEFLKQQQKNFIIVAVSSALSFLEAHDITPNIVIHLDPFEASIKSFQKVKNLQFLNDSILLFAASSPKKLLSMFPKERIFLFEATTRYKHNSMSISSNCVGSLAYLFLLVAKVKNIYILGLDLAIDSETGLDHTTSHQSTKRLTLQNALAIKEELSYKKDLFEIPGNFREKVFTTAHFNSSVNVINHYFAKIIKEFQSLYNLSDGAYFQGTKALQAKNINNLTPLHVAAQIQLQKLFHDHTSNSFTQEDIQNLKARLAYANKIATELQNHTLTTQTPACYAQEIVDIITQDRALYEFELARILDSYLYYILNYIYNFLQNTPEATQKQLVDIRLKKHLTSLIQYYENILQTAIMKEQ